MHMHTYTHTYVDTHTYTLVWHSHTVCGGGKKGLVTLPWIFCAVESMDFVGR